MTRVLRALQNHGQSWPFRTAVNKAEVPDYYEAVQNPMGTCWQHDDGGELTE